MPQRDANEVADLLEEIGRRATFEGGNPYKAKAYVRAAASLRRVPRLLHELIQEGALRSIPGIGAAIAKRIETLHSGAIDEALERMRRKLPAGLLELLAIPGLKPQTIMKLHTMLGVNALEELAMACSRGQVAMTKGLGPALERKTLQGIAIAREGQGRLRMNQAQAILDQSIAELKRLRPGLRKITIAGEMRRACELVSDLRLVAVAPKASEPKEEVFGGVTLHVCPAVRFGAVLMHATGSKAHLKQLGMVAGRKGFTLGADGLRRGGELLAAGSEEAIYKSLGLAFVPPELREGTDEIARARKGVLPDLICMKDLKGVLHLHTTFSDGVNTLEEMAEAARKRGYSYLGVTDHSQSAHYAGGLSLREIDEQHAIADELNRRYGGRFRILKGIESDILADGSLDYAPEVLERFDFVVASVHSRFRLARDEQTKRIITAAVNPCAKHGVAVEVNGNPYRLELDWRWHQEALQLGCLLSINPDAHSIAELDLVKWGVAVARKGGVAKKQVLNAMSLEAILSYLSKRRSLRRRRTLSQPQIS